MAKFLVRDPRLTKVELTQSLEKGEARVAIKIPAGNFRTVSVPDRHVDRVTEKYGALLVRLPDGEEG